MIVKTRYHMVQINYIKNSIPNNLNISPITVPATIR